MRPYEWLFLILAVPYLYRAVTETILWIRIKRKWKRYKGLFYQDV